MNALTWIGIVFCISQSAMFSGLNLAVFSLSRLRLEVEMANGNPAARRVLALRRDSNFTLVTILWGNVAVNVLLTLLARSVLAGVSVFLFSTVIITLLGEILPQAYFSRHALRMAAWLEPLLRFYQYALYPVTKSTAWVLDRLVGPEAIRFFHERDLRTLIKKHAESGEAGVSAVEATGAVNFLDLDDLVLANEGQPVDPRSIFQVPFEGGRPVLPSFERTASDPFLRRIEASGRKWVILTDAEGQARAVLEANGFLRGAFFGGANFDPRKFLHHPVVVLDDRRRLGEVLSRMTVQQEHPSDDVIDCDLILVWGQNKRIITGADILGRLLHGIARREPKLSISQPNAKPGS
jgi:metal transporter CNNM